MYEGQKKYFLLYTFKQIEKEYFIQYWSKIHVNSLCDFFGGEYDIEYL